MSQGAKTGVLADAYVNVGTYASPVWLAISTARDVTLVNEFTEAEASIRGDGGFTATLTGLQKVGADFEILWDPAYAEFSMLLNNFLARVPTEFLFLDGPITPGSGAQGPRMTCVISKLARKEPLDNPITGDVSVRRTISPNPTSWYTA